jgi:hypothetical protein
MMAELGVAAGLVMNEKPAAFKSAENDLRFEE